MTEFFEAIHGRNEANSIDDPKGSPSAQSKAPSKSEMDALLEKYG